MITKVPKKFSRNKSCQMELSTLICPKCNNKAYIWRPSGKKRKTGHLKKLYCYKCKIKINHIEVGEYVEEI